MAGITNNRGCVGVGHDDWDATTANNDDGVIMEMRREPQVGFRDMKGKVDIQMFI